ncbi:hypothetical protein ACFSOZ_25270 [Mesorhizobium newzealandense]|uniref:Uncharacterized protein n=1 Tax=Mesorhizobium newzealandense TaxID=1300302 RepID=A0ABW4UFI0_9HYPH
MANIGTAMAILAGFRAFRSDHHQKRALWPSADAASGIFIERIDNFEIVATVRSIASPPGLPRRMQ